MIKTVIFDYAGVLTATKNNYKFAKKYHKRFGLDADELMGLTYAKWKPALISKESESEYWSELEKALGTDQVILKDLIIKTFPLDLRIIKIIDKIKNKYKIVMMSNQVESWLEDVIRRDNLKEKFHYFINSYNVGLTKPDLEIFKLALRETKSEPQETLFVDDSVENIEAAKKMGIQVILFITFEQFMKEFSEYI